MNTERTNDNGRLGWVLHQDSPTTLKMITRRQTAAVAHYSDENVRGWRGWWWRNGIVESRCGDDVLWWMTVLGRLMQEDRGRRVLKCETFVGVQELRTVLNGRFNGKHLLMRRSVHAWHFECGRRWWRLPFSWRLGRRRGREKLTTRRLGRAVWRDV